MGAFKRLALVAALTGLAPLSAAQANTLGNSGIETAKTASEDTVPGSSVTTASLGLDHSEGKYGESRTSRTTTSSLMIRHETGRFTFRANIPWIHATGTRSAGGDRGTPTRQSESGLGDITLSGFYNAYNNTEAKYGIDIGTKVKLATADDSKSLLTTGKNDYSLQTDLYKTYGKTSIFASLGWTKKGDPDPVNFRNPWYGSLGVAYKTSASTSVGASYDYRQKLTRSGDPVSEATLFLTHKLGKQVKLQAYLVGGFSDSSPDLGGGAVISVSY